MLAASCVLAGLIASQAVYYDDDGDPTGVRMQHASNCGLSRRLQRVVYVALRWLYR